jgi:glycosyltransferase involved in cell wall biosynthesis
MLTAADDSSGHYRIRLPAAYAEAEAEVVPEKRGLALEISRTGHLAGLDVETDVMVLQRPMFKLMPEVIDHLQAKGIAVVVELDDDFHTAHPHNRAFRLNHPSTSPDYNWQHLRRCVQKADLVTVSTDQLARRYGGHGRVAVLRNYIDQAVTMIKRRGSGHTLGWAGTLVNHPVDLLAARGGVGQAMQQHPDWRFLNIGGAKQHDEIAAQLEIDPEHMVSSGWHPLELHLPLVAQLDVGVVPLHDSSFNAAKSWLKGLEYAALGIPFVASNLPEYERLASAYGLGLAVPSRARDWRRALTALMADPDLTAMTGVHYRARVVQALTIESHAWRWDEAWATALEHRRKTAITTK